MPRRVRAGEEEVRAPLLTGESDSDEGEIIFNRMAPSLDNDGDEDPGKASTYEEAIEKAGFGLFHWALLLVCGWANASDAVEILCVSFLLPTARCDLRLTSSDMGLLTASIFLGMMAGGYVWGYLADQRGRRNVLVVSLTINGVFGSLASLAPAFWLFLLFRFISGVGVGGSIPVIFSYFSEFMPRLRRGMMISALATFWMAGNILAAGLAWMVIPRPGSFFSLGSLDFQSWRMFVALCSIPSLTSAVIFIFMPESPKFLMEAAREDEAVRVFQAMFRVNTWRKGRGLPEFHLCSKERSASEESRGSPGVLSSLKRALLPVKQLFSSQLKARSVILLVIFYSISFGYYGLWMWFPELLKRVEEGGSPCANVSVLARVDNSSCYPVKTVVYKEGFYIAASNLPGNVFTILLMDSTGAKVLLSCSLVVSSLSIFFIYVVQTRVQSLLLSCVFSGVSVICWNSLDVLGTELYPTQLRSSALGFFTGVGRVAAITANIVFGKLVDTNCAVPVLLVSALLLTGGLVAVLLPQTKHTELT